MIRAASGCNTHPESIQVGQISFLHIGDLKEKKQKFIFYIEIEENISEIKEDFSGQVLTIKGKALEFTASEGVPLGLQSTEIQSWCSLNITVFYFSWEPEYKRNPITRKLEINLPLTINSLHSS
ncbi:uncharacterized protein isoform X2 [Leptinotarsa decemlineata]|uniref:uncharacterized protein isoform X2 n=1 Tax=Leptinotarsa decemlineata TaxID=7539 RepID=UPI003D309452